MSRLFGARGRARRRCGVLAAFAVALAASSAQARITRIVIDEPNSQPLIFSGTTFAESGAQYRKIAGRAYGEVNPRDRFNSLIVDIGRAPTNAAGKVDYSVNFVLLLPTDPAHGNRRMFALIPNRGNPNGLSNMVGGAFPTVGYNLDMTASNPGSGFLMRKGFSILIPGWDISADATNPASYSIDAPVATRRHGERDHDDDDDDERGNRHRLPHDPHGRAIVGPSLEEFVVDNSTTTLSGAFQYRAADASNTGANKSRARLYYRVLVADPPVEVPATQWEYADDLHLRLLPAGTPFERGLYEFVYPAKDPLVAGLGLAALRDVMSFFKYESADDAGTANPLAGQVQYIYTHCSSQPCRTMHDYVHLGFNQDEARRQVMDGALNWIAAGNFLKLNYRFSNAGRTHRQHIGRWYPEFEFPFSNLVFRDSVTHEVDGKFRRCLRTQTCPKWFEVFSENEYTAKAGSTTHYDRRLGDLPDPPHTRLYLMASLPHGASASTAPGNCQQNQNPLQPYSVLRAQLMNLDRWVTFGAQPPATRLPRFDDGTLVEPLPQAAVGFPAIPARPPVPNPVAGANPPLLDQGLAVIYNGHAHTGDLFDYGPRYEEQGIVDHFPPRLKRKTYPVLVPKTDADGNGIAGIRLPEVAVPTATYTGWALRATLPGYQTEATRGGADGCDASGQKIMFRATLAGRLAIGDPRRSLEERYANKADYVAKVKQAAEELRDAGLMLQEDVDIYINGAGAAYDNAIRATP
jgi:Alpha/beta hydrolase domain